MTLISINVDERYNDMVVQVKGSGNQIKEIFVFTLSTCMWCSLGKKWLEEKGYGYSYLDIDKCQVEERNQLKAELRELFGEKPRFPFIIVDKKKWVSGYNSSKWEEILND